MLGTDLDRASHDDEAGARRLARAEYLLSARQPRAVTILPLARKLASSVGIADVALLGREDDRWVPLAVGELPFKTLVSAEAWLVVPDSSEGFAAGTPVGAYLLKA